eukprot:jgi/Chrzof1/13840/Cz08g14150.t1
MFFDSPSAFSIYLKRLVNPNRKADDGWKTVKYAGKYLETYKMELLMRKYRDISGDTGSGTTPAGSSYEEQPPHKKPRIDYGPPVLRQLAPKQKGPSAPRPPIPAPAAPPQLPKFESTPRPADLGAIPAEEHDYAPREGDVPLPNDTADDEADDQNMRAAPATKHFTSGPDLESSSATASVVDEVGSNGRPRRIVKAPQRLVHTYGNKDDHDMVPCEFYSGTPGSGQPGAQPLKVKVAPSSEVVMDFHAHLDKHEVIGLLAGRWDAASRTLTVERAFPVREAGAAGSNDGINVEMDTEDQFKVQEVIYDLYHMQVVGWYHSHPTFPALPSIIDIRNQLMFQRNAQDPSTGYEPYIAAIVSPYDKRLPTLQSAVTWFCVGYDHSRQIAMDKDMIEQSCLPYELSIQRLLRQDTSDAIIHLMRVLKVTAHRYARKRSAANLAAVWRDSTTRLQKLFGSIQAWLPASFSPAMKAQFTELMRLMITEVRVAASLPNIEADAGLEDTPDDDVDDEDGVVPQQPSRTRPVVAAAASSISQETAGRLAGASPSTSAAPAAALHAAVATTSRPAGGTGFSQGSSSMPTANGSFAQRAQPSYGQAAVQPQYATGSGGLHGVGGLGGGPGAYHPARHAAAADDDEEGTETEGDEEDEGGVAVYHVDREDDEMAVAAHQEAAAGGGAGGGGGYAGYAGQGLALNPQPQGGFQHNFQAEEEEEDLETEDEREDEMASEDTA